MISTQLSSLQIELLKSFAFNPTEADLIFVRKFLATYFSSKMDAGSLPTYEQWFEKASIQFIPLDGDNYPSVVREPLTNEYKKMISTQSKHALAASIAKEEPLILE